MLSTACVLVGYDEVSIAKPATQALCVCLSLQGQIESSERGFANSKVRETFSFTT